MRVALYNSLPQNEIIGITVQETDALISRSEILQDELLILEDPMISTTFTNK